MKNMGFVNIDAKPDELQETVGVSDRLQNEEFKKAILNQIRSESKDDSGEIEVDAEKLEDTVKEIAGGLGEFKMVPIDSLIPTPEEWNHFTPISKERKILMADSIHRIGLQHPIVVRKVNQEGKYEILSGNNRAEIYGILYDITQDKKYLSIPAMAYDIDEISNDQALEIVSDTNYVQRGNLSVKDKAFAIRTKVSMLKKHRQKAVMDKVSEQMGITRSSVFYWNKIFNLIPEFLSMYEEGSIGLKAASRIAGWPEDIQKTLWEYKEWISDENIMKIKAKTAPEKVVETFLSLAEGNSLEEIEPTASIQSIKKTKNKCTIKINAPMEEEYDVLVMYIPKKKVSKLRKSYGKYILDELEQEQLTQNPEEISEKKEQEMP